MHAVRWSLSLCVALAAVPALASPSRGVSRPPLDSGTELEAQPRMRAALVSLEAARAQLAKATHDKGGHRVKALVHVKIAISETKKGMSFDDHTSESVSDSASPLAEPQGHMVAAVKLLETARKQLEKASHDKGGHRVKAIVAVDAALAEARSGIAYDDAH